jgi:hypothetical protein
MKMKKYLMTGIAALALCVGFTSCSHDLETLSQEEIDQLKAQQVLEKYNQAFIATFGEPAANQDWGFGPSAGSRTRTENANANEWADPDKEYGGLLVPPPLTDTQIAVVKKYFQTHPNLGYEDPKWSNYFIQQVYKGHTDVPEGCATPEAYKSADNNDIIASDHMDHLVAIDEENNIFDHINNFNHGDCSTNDNVLDNGGNANDGPFHSDKIMYMKNSTTKSFGYYNSDGSLYHNEYTGLVSFQTIIDDLGAEANCLNDGWNRSFMGFDFEQMVGEDLYARELDYQVEGGWNAEKWGPEGFPEGDYKWFEWKGVKYHQLKSNMNMYAGTLFTCDDTYLQNETNVDNLLADGYLPVDGGANKKWVKVGGTADGYFSDWIVTLTEAKTPGPGPTPDPFVADLRIMAEDLSATEKSDYDFNDIVFDVQFNRAATETTDAKPARILVRAAGGTLPLRIKVKSSALSSDPTYTGKDGNGWQEVHALWNKSTGIMINTNATQRVSPSKGYEADYELDPIDLDYTVANAADAKNITIEVLKNGQWIEMRAQVGMPAAKFACTPSHDWAEERQSLSGNSNFEDWVQGKADYWQWY